MTVSLLKQTARQAAIIIISLNVVSLVFGVIRESLLASYFGTSAEYDVLLVALAIPLMVSGILFMSIPAAGIPFLQGGVATASRKWGIFGSPFITMNSLLTIVVAGGIFIILPLFSGLLSKGMEPHRVDSVVRYGRLFCLLIPFRAYEAVFRSLLHIRHHFIFPSLTALLFNLVVIAILVILYPPLGSVAFMIAWTSGAFLQALMLAVPSFFMYRRSHDSLEQADFRAAHYLRYLGVIVLIETMGLIVDPFDKYLGGIFLESGFVSAVSYANVVNSVPLRIVIFSLGTAIFPTLSEKAAGNDLAGLAKLYHKAIAICVMLILPLSVFSLIFKDEIVGLLFERGKFVASSRMITVEVLKYYLAGMIFQAMFFVQLRVFYALKIWKHLISFRVITLILKCSVGLLLINADWAAAIGGGTIAMMTASFLLMEIHLVFGKRIGYTRQDITLIAKAFLNASVAVTLFLTISYLAAPLLEYNRIVLMFATGVVGFSALLLMDQVASVSGMKIGNLLSDPRK